MWEFNSPRRYIFFLPYDACRYFPPDIFSVVKDIERYFQKTYAGWLGKNIGIRLGSPIEGWSAEQIKKTYGEVTHYLVTYQDYAADDDSNGPAFFVRALIDYSHAIDKITEKEMGNTWLNYVPEEHGFFWWGGYGISSEHTAYQNLCYGIDAPQSGAIEQNGKTCAEQIGGQIFSDCWGFVAPGNPQLAARYAEKMARVSHDGEGVYGGMFIAACISAAYVQTSIHDIIQAGLSVIPAHCQYAIVVKSIIAFHQHNPDNWRACLSSIHEHYGYDKYRGGLPHHTKCSTHYFIFIIWKRRFFLLHNVFAACAAGILIVMQAMLEQLLGYLLVYKALSINGTAQSMTCIYLPV